MHGDGRPNSLFETERLTVRQITRNDYVAMYSVYSNPEAMKYVSTGSPITPEACQRWVERTLENYERRGYGMSAVVLKATKVVIGFCGIVHPNDQPTPEIKYAFLQAHWGQGFATEAARALLQFGIGTLGLNYIIATIHADHAASQRVVTKVGMKHTDTLPDEDGTFTLVYEMKLAAE